MNNADKLREILNNYEAEYSHEDWLKLEKDLPKPSKFFSKQTAKYTIVTGIVATIIAILVIFNYDNIFETNKIEDDRIASQTEINDMSSTASNNNIEEKTPNNNSNEKECKAPVITENKAELIKAEPHTCLIDKDKITNIDKEDCVANEIVESNKENEEKIDKNIDSSPISVDYDNINEFENMAIDINIRNNCTPAKVIFTITDLPEGYKIRWTLEKNKTLKGQMIEHIYTKPGEYFPIARVVNAENQTIKELKLEPIVIHEAAKLEISYNELDKLTYNFFSNIEKDLDIHWTINNEKIIGNDIIYNFANPGGYNIKLYATNNFGCKTEVVENLIIKHKNLYYLPDAFTPLTLGKNSEFGPIGENLSFEVFQFTILNEKGNIVFNTNNPNEKWNGKINNKGEYAKEGVYFWEIKTIDKYKNSENRKGKVSLIIR